MKCCSKCKQLKPVSEFRKTGNQCKTCLAKVAAKWEKSPKGRLWKRNDKLKRYGITLIEYEELWTLQNGICAICGNPEDIIDRGTARNLAVDHNHKSNRVRGLLCTRCNSGLGYFAENPKILQQAIKYLKKYEKNVEKVPKIY